MIKAIADVQERSFGPDGRRLAGSWPQPDPPPGLAHLLAHTPLALVSAAQWRWREGRAVPSRCLPTTNLALYLAGSGTVWIEGQAHQVHSGVLIITPRAWSQRVAHDPGQPFRALSLHAQMPVFGGGQDLPAVLGLPLRIVLDPLDDTVITMAMHSLARLDACRPPAWTTTAAAWLQVLVHHLAHHHAPAQSPDLPASQDLARLAPAIAHIDRHLADGAIPLADLAELVGRSPVATRRLFQRVTGLPPNRFIQNRRIDRACRLLSRGLTIAAVAEAVGCADPSTFHRLFRHWTGLSPQTWRRCAAE